MLIQRLALPRYLLFRHIHAMQEHHPLVPWALPPGYRSEMDPSWRSPGRVRGYGQEFLRMGADLSVPRVA